MVEREGKGKVIERSFLPFISVSYENVLLPVIISYLIPMGFFIILTVKVSENSQRVSLLSICLW